MPRIPLRGSIPLPNPPPIRSWESLVDVVAVSRTSSLPVTTSAMRRVQVKLIKMGGRLVRHSRRLIFQLSEVSVPRWLFQGVLDRICRLSPAPS